MPQIIGGGPGIILEGAHHRVLADNGLAPGAGICGWVTGDFARDGGRDQRGWLGEAGICGDAGPVRAGAGFGLSRMEADVPLGGAIDVDGWHVTGEVDIRAGNSGLVISATGVYGEFDVATRRAYQSGATTVTSDGHTDGHALALRARVDWFDAMRIGGVSFAPFASYTWRRVKMAGYAEVGGPFPAAVSPVTDEASEGRVGLAASAALTSTTNLRLGGEWAHRFDQTDSGGAVTILGGLGGTVFGPLAVERNWGRVFADLDQHIAPGAVITASVLATTDEGEDYGVTGSVGLRIRF